MVTEREQSTPLDVRNASKTFGSTTVLHNADLRIGPGEVHALVGANGAGKSTLVRCITGVYPPDEGGTIAVGATPAPDNYTPLVAMRMGVRVVHQEAPIVDALTLAEVAGLQRGFPKLPGGLINGGGSAARRLRRYSALGSLFHPRPTVASCCRESVRWSCSPSPSQTWRTVPACSSSTSRRRRFRRRTQSSSWRPSRWRRRTVLARCSSPIALPRCSRSPTA